MNNAEPVLTIEIHGTQVTLLGTAHVSRASEEKVYELLGNGRFDAVAVELCPSRYNAIVNPDALAKMDIIQILRERKVVMVVATLALGAYQQRIAEQFDILPGAEMRAAIKLAKQHGLPVILVDREISTTLKRIYRNVPWWRKWQLFMGLIGSVVTREQVSEQEIERLKEGDILETTFAQFADQAEDLFIPLIDERDQYMAARLADETSKSDYGNILAVIGAGHLRGMHKCLRKIEPPYDKLIADLDTIPRPSLWPKTVPWLIVMLIMFGFIIGFQRSPELGWQLVKEWVVINGGLAAVGALIAGAHPVTVVSAFVAAPLTSLNPMIGAGMVTGVVESVLRRPKVADFGKLRNDTKHLSGWWKNRITRILLVFIASTIGSALGTYIAGYRIFDELT